MASPMNYQSTQADGRSVHFGGAVVSGKEFGRGVELNPVTSTTAASVPNVMPAGDDANIGLVVKAKGTGTLTLGDSSNTVSILGGTVNVGSTATGAQPFKGAFSTTSTASWTAITSGHGTEFTFSTATVACQTGDLVSVSLVIDTANLSSQTLIAWTRLSTTASSRLTVCLNNTGSTAGSTGSGTFQISWIDLT